MTHEFPELGPDAIPAIAALCQRGAIWPPTLDELTDSLTKTDPPCLVRGDPDIGVVVTTRWHGQGHVRLLVVTPARRGEGWGRRLLEAAESDLADCPSVTLGADPPWYLYAGIPIESTPTAAFAEHMGYTRVDTAYNVEVDLTDLPERLGGARLVEATDLDRVSQWCTIHWPWWEPEAMQAARRGTLTIADDPTDANGIGGVCAWDVIRRGTLGPVCVRPDRVGGGHGRAMLLAAYHANRAMGRDHLEVSWVGPLVPYARLGGRIGRIMFIYRKDRDAP